MPESATAIRSRCVGLDRQGVDPPRQLRAQHGIDGAVGFDTGFSGEGGSGDTNPEMGFAPLAPAGMARVLMAFVENFQPQRLKGGAKLVFDLLANGAHDAHIGGRREECQARFPDSAASSPTMDPETSGCVRLYQRSQPSIIAT